MTVKEIKLELFARIAACKGIAYGGVAGPALKVRMRARAVTLESVLSWITGQEQLEKEDSL